MAASSLGKKQGIKQFGSFSDFFEKTHVYLIEIV